VDQKHNLDFLHFPQFHNLVPAFYFMERIARVLEPQKTDQ
jgi:hypothetical protein